MKRNSVSITLKENKKNIDNQNEFAKILKDYFSKVASSPEFNKNDTQSKRMACPTLKSVMKCRRSPSITTIHHVYQGISFLSALSKRLILLGKLTNSTKIKQVIMIYLLKC